MAENAAVLRLYIGLGIFNKFFKMAIYSKLALALADIRVGAKGESAKKI